MFLKFAQVSPLFSDWCLEKSNSLRRQVLILMARTRRYQKSIRHTHFSFIPSSDYFKTFCASDFIFISLALATFFLPLSFRAPAHALLRTFGRNLTDTFPKLVFRNAFFSNETLLTAMRCTSDFPRPRLNLPFSRAKTLAQMYLFQPETTVLSSC